MVLLKEAPAPARKGKTMFAQLVSTIDSFLWGWPLIILLFGTHKAPLIVFCGDGL